MALQCRRIDFKCNVKMTISGKQIKTWHSSRSRGLAHFPFSFFFTYRNNIVSLFYAILCWLKETCSTCQLATLPVQRFSLSQASGQHVFFSKDGSKKTSELGQLESQSGACFEAFCCRVFGFCSVGGDGKSNFCSILHQFARPVFVNEAIWTCS